MTKAEAVRNMAQDFYRLMPGAPDVPMDERGWLWGEVEGTDHYLFCKLIAERIVGWSGVTLPQTD